jgi:hypothetical protein
MMRLLDKTGGKRRAEDELEGEEHRRKKTEVNGLQVNDDIGEDRSWRQHFEVGGVGVNDEIDVEADEEWDACWSGEAFVDEKTGLVLNAEKAKAARLGEVEFVKKIGLDEEVEVSECYDMTGKAPISTKWVD